MLYLSIDFGTSAVKLSILDESLNTLATAKSQYPYMILPGEKVELAPDAFWAALWDGASKLDPELRAKVDYLCYDTFSPSPVFLDKDGELVYKNIITHMDRRSRAQSGYIDKLIGKDYYMNISGIYPFAGGCSAMTFIWFLQNEPEILKNSYRVGHLPTYVHKKLTGLWMVDLVNASMMGLYDTPHQSGWSDDLIKTFNLERSLFGDIYEPGKRYGSLLADVAEKLGVPAGIPVAVGTNDVAAAQMGARNKKAGEMMNTTGSSEMVSILTANPVVNPHYYLRNAALPGLWQIYSTTAGGFAVDWFYAQFAREMAEHEFYKVYVPRVIAEFKKDKTLSFDPYLTGDRQSLEKRTGAWYGLTLDATREQMLIALLRAMQGVLKTTIDEARSVQKLSPVIKVSGGLSSPEYLELKREEIPGFEFEVVDNCPILGNAELVKFYM